MGVAAAGRRPDKCLGLRGVLLHRAGRACPPSGEGCLHRAVHGGEPADHGDDFQLGPGRYPEWNPLFPEASGQVSVGNRITLRSVHPGNGRLMTVKPRITVADPGAELRWVSRLPGIMSGEHRFPLAPAGGGTRLEQSETFRGLLTAFSGKPSPKPRRASGR